MNKGLTGQFFACAQQAHYRNAPTDPDQYPYVFGLSEVPTWHTDGAGMMGGGHFRYSDLKEAGAAADAYVI